jgi:hypothetical protein
VPPDPSNPLNPKPDYINSLEQSGDWVAELKWNGDNTLIHLDSWPPVLWNRHKARLKYSPSHEVLEELKFWKEWAGDAILNVETVDKKTKTIKNLLIVHCIMAFRGEYLMGKTWEDSRKILDDAISTGLSGPQVQVSKVWKSGFWELFQKTDGSIIEGIILKNPKGKLLFSATPIKDVSWMRKIRKPSKRIGAF